MSARDEHGFTLIELLTAMTISLVVLSATLLTFETFFANDATARKATDAQESARRGIDQVTRELRNLANPTTVGSSIDVAGGYDLVFQTSDPVKRRVRYCLAPVAGGADERLWFQTTPATTALTAEMTATCPGSGWPGQTVVAEHVVNRIGGADRAVFAYGCSAATPAGQSCVDSSANYPRVISARADLYVDVNAADRTPAATRLSSAVYLRNQNEPPTASFVVAAAGIARTIQLNASASGDPEGRTLQFQWFQGTAALPPPACAGGPADQGTIGEGITLSHRFGDADVGAQPIRLRVVDPGCLYAVAGPTMVSIP